MTVPAFPEKGCESCGTTEGTVYYPLPGGTGEYICPTCSHSQALTSAARTHLTALMQETVRQWARHWAEAGATPAEVADAWDWLVEVEAGQPLKERHQRVQSILSAV